MRPLPGKLRTLFVVATALLLGYTVRALQTAPTAVLAQSRGSNQHTQSDDALAFELSGIGPNSALTVYSAVERTLYVYPAVTQGNSHVSCAFMLHMSRPGAAIERQNCAPGSIP